MCRVHIYKDLHPVHPSHFWYRTTNHLHLTVWLNAERLLAPIILHRWQFFVGEAIEALDFATNTAHHFGRTACRANWRGVVYVLWALVAKACWLLSVLERVAVLRDICKRLKLTRRHIHPSGRGSCPSQLITINYRDGRKTDSSRAWATKVEPGTLFLLSFPGFNV